MHVAWFGSEVREQAGGLHLGAGVPSNNHLAPSGMSGQEKDEEQDGCESGGVERGEERKRRSVATQTRWGGDLRAKRDKLWDSWPRLSSEGLRACCLCSTPVAGSPRMSCVRCCWLRRRSQ